MRDRFNPLIVVAAVFLVAGALFLGVRTAVAVGPAFVDHFEVTCADRGDGGPAALIRSGEGQISYECRVDDTATLAVFVGDSTVIATGETSSAADGGVEGVRFEANDRFGGNVREEYCATTAGTEKVFCRALVQTSGL